MYQRISPRASRYDYTSPDGYFVTICTKDREHYFGEIENGEMILNALGKQTRVCRNQISHFHPHCDVHDFICMPNHIHGILVIGESVGTHHMCPMNNTNGLSLRVHRNHYDPLCVGSKSGSPNMPNNMILHSHGNHVTMIISSETNVNIKILHIIFAKTQKIG
jgi:REP element-mobilizing transposase RayT